MKLPIIFAIILTVSICSCVNDGKSPAEGSTANLNKTINKESKLYANYTDNPTTQDQMDENALIDYSIEKGLDVKRTASGIYYAVEEQGKGEIMVSGQPFQAHYSGYFLDGKVFDSSYERGQPLAATVGAMNAAWNEALVTFPVGSKLKLLLPSRLGYGARGFPGYVPPNTPLVFDMHIMPLGEK
jgi:FKBP-type peptidyl-prolyl cis-trans isomerase FkpA